MATPNPVRITIELDQPRELVLTMNTFCTVEDLTGKNFMRAGSWLNIGFREIRALVYAGITEADRLAKRPEQLTLHDVGELLGADRAQEVLGQLEEAYAKSLPPKKEEGDSDGTRPLQIGLATGT